MATIYVEESPPVKGSAYTFYMSLVSQADTDTFQAAPTLAAGDVKVSIDGGASANIATLPVAIATLTKVLSCTLSAAEMTGDKIVLLFSDAAGNEWQDAMIMISTMTLGTLSQTASSAVAAMTGADLAMVIGITYTTTISGLTIPVTWTKVYLTVKEHVEDPDSSSVLQIVVSNPAVPATDGITYLNKTAATVTTRAYGTQVVNQGAGTVAVTVADEGTALIPAGNYSYDLKCLLAAGTTQQLSAGGAVTVTYTETRA